MIPSCRSEISPVWIRLEAADRGIEGGDDEGEERGKQLSEIAAANQRQKGITQREVGHQLS